MSAHKKACVFYVVAESKMKHTLFLLWNAAGGGI